MHLLGVDFTSAPSPRKPIVAVWAYWEKPGVVCLHTLQRFSDWSGFETLLQTPGPWVAAMDFPLSLPRALLQALGWPTEWSAAVEHIQQLGKSGFESALIAYQQAQPQGQKFVYRPTDRLTRSSSPMKLHYPPVGKMFFQGAIRLKAAGVCIPKLADNPDPRVVVEAYPALIARRLLKKAPYKQDNPKQQTIERFQARQSALTQLQRQVLLPEFGFSIHLAPALEKALLEDATGDTLDACFCAIQAAWASQTEHWGIPPIPEAEDGWIVDPALL
ncbi:MAG: DUF429 domain-containing protein [Candidatus Melainabacteria bacterium]|nr:DUF429 domain-containing protein [Candidatus Melainabacteria bacterium]